MNQGGCGTCYVLANLVSNGVYSDQGKRKAVVADAAFTITYIDFAG